MDKNFTDSLRTIINNKRAEAKKKRGDRVALVGFGSFSKARTGRNPKTGAEMQIPKKKLGFPGSTERFLTAYAKIAEKLAVSNPEVAKKFTDKIAAIREEQDEVAITSYKRGPVKFKAGSELADNVKSASMPAKKTVKFKAGSELADNVKSASPADVKKLADELVNLTVKETNETSKKEEPKKDSEPMDADSDDDGLLDGKVESADEAESLKAKFEEAGAEVELK